MKKNILFFCSVTQIGGAETNILKISKELHLRGYNIHFATLDDNGPMFSLCKDFASSQTIIGLFNKSPLASVRRYIQLLKTYHFDVVLNFGLRVEVFSRILTKSYSPATKVIANIRTTDSFRRWYQVALDMLTASCVDVWVSNSMAGKLAFAEREKIPPHKIKVIYNFMDNIGHYVIHNKSINKENVKIGILANIVRNKGYYDLIPLIQNLNKQNINVRFICAGIDKTNGDFLSKLQHTGLVDYFEFMGYISDKESFFDKIDIFLLPSYMEGMPTSILEAMNFGKPVISTSIDGIPEQIMHGYNGFIYPPGDIQGFAEGIKSLIEDEAIKNDFIQRSKDILVSRFDKNTNIDKWLEVINN